MIDDIDGPDDLRPEVLTGLLPGLSGSAAETLLATARRSTMEAGQVFFIQGEPSTTVGIVLRGHLKLTAVGSSGRAVLLTFWGPGDLAGHVTVINGTTRMGTAVAINPVDLLVLRAAEFMRVLVDDPRAGTAVTRQLSSWVEASARCQAVQGTEPANVRIARLLVDLCDVRTGSGGDRGEVALDLSQDELGQIVGVSRESTARVLREFRDKGIVSTRRRALTVHRLRDLEQAAGVHGPGRRHPDERVIRKPSR